MVNREPLNNLPENRCGGEFQSEHIVVNDPLTNVSFRPHSMILNNRLNSPMTPQLKRRVDQSLYPLPQVDFSTLINSNAFRGCQLAPMVQRWPWVTVVKPPKAHLKWFGLPQTLDFAMVDGKEKIVVRSLEVQTLEMSLSPKIPWPIKTHYTQFPIGSIVKLI